MGIIICSEHDRQHIVFTSPALREAILRDQVMENIFRVILRQALVDREVLDLEIVQHIDELTLQNWRRLESFSSIHLAQAGLPVCRQCYREYIDRYALTVQELRWNVKILME